MEIETIFKIVDHIKMNKPVVISRDLEFRFKEILKEYKNVSVNHFLDKNTILLFTEKYIPFFED